MGKLIGMVNLNQRAKVRASAFPRLHAVTVQQFEATDRLSFRIAANLHILT